MTMAVWSGTPAYLLWAAGVLGTRLPVAMTPLAFVFLGSQVYGSYAYGLVLVGLYAAAEACFAPLLGMRLNGSYFRREIVVGLCVSACAYALLAALGHAGMAIAWLLSILAGSGAAAVPGALRVAIGVIIRQDWVRQAFSAETVITMACWAAAPAAVAFASFHYSPLLVIAACCLLILLSLLVVLGLPERDVSVHERTSPTDENRGRRIKEVLHAWPIFVTAAIAMSIVSFLELLLPALLEERGGDPSDSGLLLSVLAVASIAGAVLYGVVKVPGSYAAQSWTAITVMVAAVGLFSYTDAPPMLIGLLCGVGVGQSVCIVARNLSLREQLRPQLHVMGFSVLYSLSGVGYGLSAGISAVALGFASAQVTVLIGLGLIVAVSAAAGIVRILQRVC